MQGTIVHVSEDGTLYNILLDQGTLITKVPYFLVSYQNEYRTWRDYFREGQLVMFMERDIGTILSVDTIDKETHCFTIQIVKTGEIFMDVDPSLVTFDVTLFK